MGRWARAASPADGERQPRSGEGVLPFLADGGADASHRQHDGPRTNDRHARRVLAVPHRGLKPGRPYTLALAGNRGRALCQPWSLATFPTPDEKPQSFRVLFYTCAGGHEAFGFLPAAIRNRLLRRALSFEPSAMVAIGDQVYWDLLAPENGPKMGASPAAE